MTRRFAALCLAFVLSWSLVTAAVAQQAAPKPDPVRIAAAKKLFTAMGVDAQYKVMVDTMTNGLAVIVRQRHPAHGAAIGDVFDSLKQKFIDRSGEMIDMIAPLWAEKFTAEDLETIADFFATPVGRKLVAVQPEIMQRSMQLGMVWGQRIGAEVEAEARIELKKRGIDL
ncbi:MAG: DUF2059 domain-containing protein [Hyphomicrobiaceae bacterium]